jgi:hypothetical protein
MRSLAPAAAPHAAPACRTRAARAAAPSPPSAPPPPPAALRTRAPAPLRCDARERRLRGACARPCRAVLDDAPGAAGSAAAVGDKQSWQCASVLKEWASVVESIADGAS